MVAHFEHMFHLGRPKFLMYSNVIYTVGVAAAYKSNPNLPFNLWSYIWICLLVHAIHAMTHYFNEYYDYEADCANKNPSPWTGGSRVLVEGKVKPKVSLLIGRLICAIVLSNAVIYYGVSGNVPATVTIVLGVIFGHGYSAWPLRTSRIGLGEATVCLVLNILVPLVGYQSHDPSSPFGNRLLWPILLPLLPIQYVRMMVMNMADLEPDKITGKLTLVARIGMQLSCVIHGIGIVFAYILHVWLYIYGYLSTVVFLLMLLPAPIGLRQIRNVCIRPWKFDNPFWSSQHNILSMAMALAGILLSGGRPLSGTSWALIFPLVLISISVPVLFKKIVEAAKAHDSLKRNIVKFAREE
ncbi:uncharacterized protein LOC114515960 [Dendronephthya gigantea]|uniref:uncharacterized protein LOC114515960 n=1 Tax=Dendronephthya gigantea TaxID=151771 RepID=UPI0010697B5C|nr:uncharacterized protein LOC114515960 [Dendronephthya gigantea]